MLYASVLVVVGVLAHLGPGVLASVDFQLEMCPAEMCTHCKQPNKLPGTLEEKISNSKRCYCSCGKKQVEPCLDSGECEIGTQCVAPFTNDVKDKNYGQCKNLCDIMREQRVCSEFHSCVQDSTGKASCQCNSFQCDTAARHPLSGVQPATKAKMTFNNMCSMVNENCKLERSGALADFLWTLQ